MYVHLNLNDKHENVEKLHNMLKALEYPVGMVIDTFTEKTRKATTSIPKRLWIKSNRRA
ncbi:MAG: hypothetical protein FWC68_02210 [Oscillospiraceae bacterium]|nr:hypothetical protein [Oscillospiraceae bacterium]